MSATLTATSIVPAAPRAPRRRSRLERMVTSSTFWRGLVGILVFLAVWQLGATSKAWLGIELPFFGKLPTPIDVAYSATEIVQQPGYWSSWVQSFRRVLTGFLLAQIIGIPFGLALAVNKYFRDIFFPPFEVLRPIPPLAWVPASLIFWPTNELSIAFVTFLGAFFTIVINVLGGARAIDVRYLRAAQSMGASQWHLFSRVILPGTLPSIFTGAAVGMGITWNVVLAAEMVSGGGNQADGGLGFFIWNSYMGGSMEQIVVGMISIGIAGYLSSTAIRLIGEYAMPWRRMI